MGTNRGPIWWSVIMIGTRNKRKKPCKEEGNMNIRFIVSILFCLLFLSCGQVKNISGTYYRKSGSSVIIITQNSLFYVEPQSHSPLHSTDTLAKCTYKWIGPEFVELNSTLPNILALQGFKVSQSSDSTLNDAIKVS